MRTSYFLGTQYESLASSNSRADIAPPENTPAMPQPPMARSAKRPRRSNVKTRLDKYDLYELAVTDGERLARFTAAVHGRSPRVLSEHFSGSGALARAWPRVVAGTGRKARAFAVDRDAGPLRKLKASASMEGVGSLTCERADVMATRTRADVIAATNFAIGYFHTRDSLVTYLSRVRRLLLAGGVFVCDLYGGSDALTPGTTRVRLRAADGSRVTYIWEQRSADAMTNRVTNAIHFEITSPRGTKRSLQDAFVYDWRLWSIAELRDAAAEAGLTDCRVFNRLADAIDSEGNVYVRPIESGGELDDPWVVYVALAPAARGMPAARARTNRSKASRRQV